MIPSLENFLLQFISLDENERSIITSYFTQMSVKKGDIILKAGEVCSDFIFIEKGGIRMYYYSGDSEISAWFSLANSVAMEVHSFITQTPSICYLQAIDDSELYILSKDDLVRLYELQPKMQEFMRKMWEAALALIIPRFSSLQNESAEERYKALLDNSELMQQIPQKYLASFIGVTPTSLSRIRKKLSRN